MHVADARDYASFFLNLSRTGGPVVRFESGGPAFLVNDPSLAQQVLATNERAYANPYHPYKELAGWYEPAGAFLAGTIRRGRSEAAQLLEDVLVAESHAAVDEWLARGDIAIALAAKALTLRTLARVMFGIDSGSEAADFIRATDFLEECYVNDVFPPEAAHAMDVQQALADRIAAHCSMTGRNGFVSEGTRSAILRTLLNGYNATGTALAWALYLLALHGGVHDLRLAVLETLRLFPPAWNLGRNALQQHQLGDCTIPAGARVFVCPYAMQRHSDLWDHPSEFLPQRFAEPPRHPFAYIPFGGGTRRCPAGHLMTRHLLQVLQVIFGRARIELRSEPVRPRGLVALRPAGDIVLRFTPVQ